MSGRKIATVMVMILAAIAIAQPRTWTDEQVTSIAEGTSAMRTVVTCTTSTEQCEPLTVIPWVESNYATFDEQIIDGLRIWGMYVHSAIVTTLPERPCLYTKLAERVDPQHIEIIPGIKTKSLLAPFHSVDGWRAVADVVDAMRETSGQNVFAFEHERAVEAVMRGTEVLDAEALREGLALLPPDMTYLWSPSLYWYAATEAEGGADVGSERLAKLCEVVDSALPRVRFLDLRYCANYLVDSGRYVRGKARLDSFVTWLPVPKAFFYGDYQSHVWWKDNELSAWLALVRRDWGPRADALVYTGHARFAEAAAILGPQLYPPCYPADLARGSLTPFEE